MSDVLDEMGFTDVVKSNFEREMVSIIMGDTKAGTSAM